MIEYKGYRLIACPKTKRVWDFSEGKYIKYKVWKYNLSSLDWPILGFLCNKCYIADPSNKIFEYKDSKVCLSCLKEILK